MTDFIRRFASENDSERSEIKKRKRESDDGRPQKPRVVFDNPPVKKNYKRKSETDHARPQRPRFDAENSSESKSHKRKAEHDAEQSVEKRIKQRDTVPFPPPPPPPPKRLPVPKKPQNNENAKENAPVSSSTLSMYNYTLNLLKQDVKEKSEKLRKSRIMERWEYGRLAQTNEVECEGDMRCRLMDEALAYIEKKGLEFSPQQKVILRALRVCSYAQFYGDTIQFHLPRLLGLSGTSEIRSELLAFLARRQGKTTVVTANCACELVTQPFGHDICIYANNGRASRLAMMMMYKFVRILSAPEAGFGGRINNLNKNEGMSYMTRWGTINKVTAFPAKEENLRGTGSTETTGTVIIDEINYCSPSMVSKIISPTLIRKRVKFVGITTISGYDSFVTPLADARFPDGRKVMLTLNFEMVCEDCKARGEPEKCKCLMADLPHWHLSTQLEKLEILMKADPDTYLREMKNVATDSSITSAFDPRDVAHLRKPECVMRMTEIIAPTIFIAVDPACGGDMSKMAIVSAIYVESMMIVSVYLLRVFVSKIAPVRNSARTASTYFRSPSSNATYRFVSCTSPSKKFRTDARE